MQIMRVAAASFAVAGVLLVAFGWWGTETRAGRQDFDEMAGMIPFSAEVVGAVLLACAAVLAIVDWHKRDP